MIKLAIVEDEDHFANDLTEYIDKYSQESGTLFDVTRYRDGDEITEEYTGEYDIILMDIQMQFMDGMTAAEEIRKLDKDVVIMFITNMINYAIRGYEVDALDYVLKPITYFAFAKKLQRAVERVKNRSSHVISVSTKDGVMKLDCDDIFFIESQGHNLSYHTRSGEYVTRSKMQDAEDAVSDFGFFRINKGYLVNMRHVDGVKDSCALVKGEMLPVSRARRNEFMVALADYIGDF